MDFVKQPYNVNQPDKHEKQDRIMRFTAINHLLGPLLIIHCATTKPVPPTPNPPDYHVPACAEVLPDGENACDGKFTADGLACVMCPYTYSCLDQTDMIYCTSDKGCDDPLCVQR